MITVAMALAGVAMLPKADALTPAEVFLKVSPSVWKIRTFDKAGAGMKEGSGVVIGPETLVTNCHVLLKAATAVVVQGNVSFGARLELWDTEHDVCQVRVKGLTAPAATMVAPEDLRVGQAVFALGSPAGLELTLSSGLISNLRRAESGKIDRILTTAPISPGSSGGGLFDEQGRLVGLTQGGIVGGNTQNLNFAIPTSHIEELPGRHAARQAARETEGGSPLSTPVPPARPASPTPQAAAVTDRLGPVTDFSLPSPTAFVPAAVLPARLENRDRNYQRYLSEPLPKAFAISDNGHSARSSGTTPREAHRPSDPKARALQICAENAGRACTLFSVDNVVVYRP